MPKTKTKRPTFEMAASKGVGEILIYEDISDWWGVNAKQFAEDLKALGDVSLINVRINSRGGSVPAASAIYNTLLRHPATIEVDIDGNALSAASLVAMAGDTIRMARNATIMIHNASWEVAGNSEQLRKSADLLDKMTATLVTTYAERTGIDAEEIEQMMSDETWLFADEALELGFVDEVTPAKRIAAYVDPTQYDYRNIPAQLTKKPRRRQPGNSTTPRRKNAMSKDNTPNNTPDKQDPPKEPENKDPAGDPKPGEPKKKDTPDTPAPQNKPADTPAPIDQAEIDKRIDLAIGRENERCTKIRALCNKAGKPDLAAQFMENRDLTVEDVQGKLLDELCKDRPPVGDGGGNDLEDKKDPDARFKREYADARATFQNANISEAEYVASRRVDEGLENLATAKPEK